MKLPECYSHLWDDKTEECQSCLLLSKCKVAMGTGVKISSNGELPKSKNELILAVCRKYGLSTVYRSRSENKDYEISEQTMPDWDISSLLNNKEALRKLLLTELK